MLLDVADGEPVALLENVSTGNAVLLDVVDGEPVALLEM
jgi:hypothetical protein